MLEGHTGDDARDMLRSGSIVTERLYIDNKQDLKKKNKKKKTCLEALEGIISL